MKSGLRYSGNSSRVNITTTSWYYILVFYDRDAYIIPLSFGEETIEHREIIHLNTDTVKMINDKELGQLYILKIVMRYWSLFGYQIINEVMDIL